MTIGPFNRVVRPASALRASWLAALSAQQSYHNSQRSDNEIVRRGVVCLLFVWSPRALREHFRNRVRKAGVGAKSLARSPQMVLATLCWNFLRSDFALGKIICVPKTNAFVEGCTKVG
jgi:hypothetical protein